MIDPTLEKRRYGENTGRPEGTHALPLLPQNIQPGRLAPTTHTGSPSRTEGPRPRHLIAGDSARSDHARDASG